MIVVQRLQSSVYLIVCRCMDQSMPVGQMFSPKIAPSPSGIVMHRHVSQAEPTCHFKRHLDRFSRFCMVPNAMLYNRTGVSPSGRFPSDRHKPGGTFEVGIYLQRRAHELPDRSGHGDESICQWLSYRQIRGCRLRPLKPRSDTDVGANLQTNRQPYCNSHGFVT